jgi:hypothetical protein
MVSNPNPLKGPQPGSTYTGSHYTKTRPSKSSVDIEELVFRIRKSAAIRLERQQAMLDGVTLAAEQVQDKRLELAEKKSADADDSLATFLVVFALESTLAGPVLVGLTKRIVYPLLRTNLAFRLLPRSDSGKALTRLPDFTKNGDFGLEEMMGFYHQSIETMIEEAPGAITIPFIKAKREAGGSPEPLGLGSTPGVAITEQVQSTASNTRGIVMIQHAEFEKRVRQGQLQGRALEDLLGLVSLEKVSLEDQTTSLRTGYAQLFEVLIWSRLLGFRFDRKNPFASLPKLVGGTLGASIDGIPEALYAYWHGRFAESIKSWSQRAAGQPDSRGGRIVPIKESLATETPRQRQVYLVREYLLYADRDLHHLFPDSALRLRPDPPPPIPKK